MSPRARCSFRKNGDRLFPLERARNRKRLVLGAFAVGAFDVDSVVLVGEPVDEWVTKLVLGDERRTQFAAQDQDIEPARMIGDD